MDVTIVPLKLMIMLMLKMIDTELTLLMILIMYTKIILSIQDFEQFLLTKPQLDKETIISKHETGSNGTITVELIKREQSKVSESFLVFLVRDSL